MTIKLKTRKMLWGRSGNRCAFPNCRRELVEDISATDDPSLVGEEAHIIARKNDGPRGRTSVPLDERDAYDNLILLCSIHHKLIDDQRDTYTVDQLRTMKADHERWVQRSLIGYSQLEQQDLEYYAWIVDEWATRVRLSDWSEWTSYLLGSAWPRIEKDQYAHLIELRSWLFERIWLSKFKELEAAFENFRLILCDLIDVFDKHRSEHPTEPETFWCTKKYYKAREFTEAQYRWLARDYEFHVDLIQDLVLELTRAANLLCDSVRAHIDPAYRLHEGIPTITYGPNERFQFLTLRVSYKAEEHVGNLYPGLEDFKLCRSDRDTHIGIGVQANAVPYPYD